MKKLFLLGALVASLALVGCSSTGDAGDVEAAQPASAAAPKTAEDLNQQNLPPDAQRGAAAAIQQNQAQKEQMDAQAEAMRRARANAR